MTYQETFHDPQNILMNAPLGVFTATPEGRLISANPALARMLGYDSPQKFIESAGDIGQQLYADPSDGEKVIHLLKKDGRVCDHKCSVLRRDGSVAWTSVNINKVRDNNGRVIYWHGFITDITQSRQTEEALVKARTQAKSAIKAKSEFLANMSHEIRTPINGIMGALQILESSCLDPNQRDLLQLAISSAKRLNRLFSDILDLTAVEPGKVTTQESEFNLAELCESVSDLFAFEAENKGLDFRHTISAGIPSCLIGDQARVRQVLFNLVGNALKYTDQGQVRLSISPLTPCHEGSIRILFTVSDTGMGLPEEKLDDLFKPFVQGDNSYTRKYEGAGLGLAIVKRFVNLLGGNISISSLEGHGTDVYVALPFRLPEKASAVRRQESSQLLDPGKGLHILLAEDDPVNQFATQKMLEALGHTVTCVDNGRHVLELLKNSEFDCVVMDIRMPEMNGDEVTRIIRASDDLGSKKDIHIIALTAHAMVGDRERFIESGMNNYLAKPVKIEDLKKAFEAFTGESGG